MKANPRRQWRHPAFRLQIVGVLGLLALSGCRTPSLETARGHFYANNIEQADQQLEELPRDHHKNQVLYLMERGTIRQAGNNLEASTDDWLRAVRLLEANEAYSLSRGTTSLMVNDQSLRFRGFPYERTLLRAMLAKNFLARGQWQSAAVEARNIIAQLEDLNGFPDDAFSRYVAGFSLEMNHDHEGAALQYRMADALLDGLFIDDRTGRIRLTPAPETPPQAPTALAPDQAELVVFVMTGRSPPGEATFLETGPVAMTGYAEFYDHGNYLGRSYRFSDINSLLADSRQRTLVLQVVKDVSRIIVKETIIQAILRENRDLGLLAGILLYGTERPDTRRWETLPHALQVARFDCPADMTQITIVYRDHAGRVHQTRTVAAPFSGRDRRLFFFCRDTPPFPPEHAFTGRPGF